jgi:hypothetical protein
MYPLLIGPLGYAWMPLICWPLLTGNTLVYALPVGWNPRLYVGDWTYLTGSSTITVGCFSITMGAGEPNVRRRIITRGVRHCAHQPHQQIKSAISRAMTTNATTTPTTIPIIRASLSRLVVVELEDEAVGE